MASTALCLALPTLRLHAYGAMERRAAESVRAYASNDLDGAEFHARCFDAAARDYAALALTTDRAASGLSDSALAALGFDLNIYRAVFGLGAVNRRASERRERTIALGHYAVSGAEDGETLTHAVRQIDGFAAEISAARKEWNARETARAAKESADVSAALAAPRDYSQDVDGAAFDALYALLACDTCGHPTAKEIGFCPSCDPNGDNPYDADDTDGECFACLMANGLCAACERAADDAPQYSRTFAATHGDCVVCGEYAAILPWCTECGEFARRNMERTRAQNHGYLMPRTHGAHDFPQCRNRCGNETLIDGTQCDHCAYARIMRDGGITAHVAKHGAQSPTERAEPTLALASLAPLALTHHGCASSIALTASGLVLTTQDGAEHIFSVSADDVRAALAEHDTNERAARVWNVY